MINEILAVIAANMLPTMEQIGGITLGINLGLDPILVLLVSLTVNCMLFFPIYFGMDFFYDKIFKRMKLFDKYLERARNSGKPYLDKYGIFGLTLFIALPTPLTGTYTASIISWFFELDWKKSFIAIFFGSAIGAMVIFFGYYGAFNFLKYILNF
jgi:uncharacterized membrane protein